MAAIMLHCGHQESAGITAHAVWAIVTIVTCIAGISDKFGNSFLIYANYIKRYCINLETK